MGMSRHQLLEASGDVDTPGEHIWNFTRLRMGMGWRGWALLLLWVPFGLVLCMLRVLLWPLAMVFFLLADCQGLGICFVRLLQPLFGFLVTVRGEENLHRSAAPIVASNHVSDFDAVAIWAALLPTQQRLVVNEHARPVISCAWRLGWRLGWPIDPIFVSSASVREDIRAAVQDAADDAAKAPRRPVLIFPEGRSSSGVTVMRFHDFVFSLGEAVVPCAITLANPWPLQVQCNGGVTWMQNLLWFFFVPGVAYEVTFLPPVSASGLDASGFSEKVRGAICDQLGVRASRLSGKDKVAFSQALRSLRSGGSADLPKVPARLADV